MFGRFNAVPSPSSSSRCATPSPVFTPLSPLSTNSTPSTIRRVRNASPSTPSPPSEEGYLLPIPAHNTPSTPKPLCKNNKGAYAYPGYAQKSLHSRRKSGDAKLMIIRPPPEGHSVASPSRGSYRHGVAPLHHPKSPANNEFEAHTHSIPLASPQPVRTPKRATFPLN